MTRAWCSLRILPDAELSVALPIGVQYQDRHRKRRSRSRRQRLRRKPKTLWPSSCLVVVGVTGEGNVGSGQCIPTMPLRSVPGESEACIGHDDAEPVHQGVTALRRHVR